MPRKLAIRTKLVKNCKKGTEAANQRIQASSRNRTTKPTRKSLRPGEARVKPKLSPETGALVPIVIALSNASFCIREPLGSVCSTALSESKGVLHLENRPLRSAPTSLDNCSVKGTSP